MAGFAAVPPTPTGHRIDTIRCRNTTDPVCLAVGMVGVQLNQVASLKQGGFEMEVAKELLQALDEIGRAHV